MAHISGSYPVMGVLRRRNGGFHCHNYLIFRDWENKTTFEMKKVLYIVLELTLEFYILFDFLPSHFYQVQLVLETGKYHLSKGHEHYSGHIICRFS